MTAAPASATLRSQAAIVDLYTLVAVLYCGASSWLFYQVADIPLLGTTHLIALTVIAGNYLALRSTGNYQVASHVILSQGTLVVVPLLFTGGWEGTGMLWTFAYLPYAFFLADSAVSRFWVGTLLVLDALATGLHAAGAIRMPYSAVELGVFWAALLVFVFCMFLFQRAVRRSEAVAQASLVDAHAANARLGRSESRLTDAQRLARVGSWSLDVQTRAVETSATLRELLGMSDAAPGDQETWLRFVDEADAPRAREALQRAVLGSAMDVELGVRSAQGDRRVLHVRGQPESDASGRVVRVHGTAQDVTALRHAEDARRRAALQVQEIESLKEISRLKTQFMNTAAHELSTPLTPIQIEVNLLREGKLDGARRQKALDVLDRNVKRLGLLVHDLLDGAKVQSAQLALQRQLQDLHQLAADTVQAHADTAHQAGVELRLAGNPGLWVNVDARRIAQVLDNLVANAIKFTPAGGKVTVTAVHASGGCAVRVADTGAGLRPEDIPRLFQPFVQVHSPMERTQAGTGLGLYIARGLVEAHGGHIGVESPGPGKGATFWFVLPGHHGPPR